MKAYARHVQTKVTPQSQPVFNRVDQVLNNAGGYVFKTKPEVQLDRFLILGNEGGTYYATEHKMTVDNAKCIISLIKADGVKVVDRIVEISDAGRAPKNDPAIFALAMCLKHGDVETRRAVIEALPKVARIGTHLFQFAESVQALGGWGRVTRKAFQNWYNSKHTAELAFQMAKYQQRNGWAHKDIIRLSHVKEEDNARQHLFSWAGVPYTTKGYSSDIDELSIITGMNKAQNATSAHEVANIIQEYKLPRECVPTQFLKDAEVWDAMLGHMGLTAIIRNLGVMTACGLIAPLSKASKFIVDKLTNAAQLKKARVHPIDVLCALRVYEQGHGERGNLAWRANDRIVDALNDAFYSAFGNVTPTGKNILIGLDVSGSMGWGNIAGKPGLTPAVAAAAMCLVTAATEKNYQIMGFANTLRDLNISPKDKLDTVVRRTAGLTFGGTDCSLPIIYAARQKMAVDTFIVYTDNETWAGQIHPFQALQMYRKDFVKDARLIVVGMTATNFTIADPSDPGMLDVVGFDTATPNLMSAFMRGEF